MPKHSASILELAKRGARVRFEELKAEIDALVKQFPYLREGFGGSFPVPVEAVKRRPRRRMSAAQKKAVSARMKKYWAAKRKKAST